METENKEQNVEDHKEGSGVTSTMTTKHEQVIDEVSEDQEKFFQNIPPGYRFCPFDEELIVDYLKKKILKQTLPPNRIVEVNIYHFNPETLAEKYEKYGENEKEWYFLTPRDRKYKNGSRPNRAAGDGYWKATGADKTIKYNNQIVGYRNVLVFYRGKPPKGTKTSWIMHEFRVSDPPQIIKRDEFDMKLDEWVLCRIYKKEETNHVRSNKRKKESIDQESDLKEKKKIILMDAGEITPFNNGIMCQKSYLDCQSNTTPNNHHLYQLNTPFKQGSMDYRKFIFPNDNENYLGGYAIDKRANYFGGPTTYSLQHLLEMDDEEEVDLMIRQFHTPDSNNLEG